MNEHILDAELNDYIDGLLSGTAAARVREHLTVCAGCHREADELAELRAALPRLPREIQPARDLRAGIAQRIATGRGVRTGGRMRVARRAFALVAAAAALILTTSTVTRWWVTRPGAPSAQTNSAYNTHATATPVAFRSEEFRYVKEITELQRDVQHAGLSPETVRILQRNLAIIDRAIQESRAAVAQDPANRDLHQMVFSAYRQKLELLRRARSSAS